MGVLTSGIGRAACALSSLGAGATAGCRCVVHFVLEAPPPPYLIK